MNSNFFKMNLILSSVFLALAVIITNCQAATRDYFSLAYDGMKYKMNRIGYSGEPSAPDPTTKYEAYFLASGTKVVSNINCLQWYSSPDEFISDDDDISYEAVINNLLVTVGSDERSSSGITVSTSRYNPYYLSMKLDMEVGDSYSQSYTTVEQSSYGEYTSIGEVTIEILAIEGIDTYYGSYPDTLKYRVTDTLTGEFQGSTYTTSLSVTYWQSSSADQVRSIAEGEGFTDTVDYLWEELTSPIETDTDGEGIDPNCNGSDCQSLLTQTEVSQLYVSIFGRASEGGGNAYWSSEQDDMTIAANTMLNTEPAKVYFGDTLNDNQAFIEFIYENTLGKTYAQDPDGVDYWVGELVGGKSKGEVVATLINAAIDPQYAGLAAQDQFLNKVAVSNYTADTISTVSDVNDLSAFVAFISNVTDDPETVVAAKAAVDAF